MGKILKIDRKELRKAYKEYWGFSPTRQAMKEAIEDIEDGGDIELAIHNADNFMA